MISAVALTLVFGLSKFSNFAHAEFMVFGGFFGYFIAEQLSWPVPIAFIAAFLAAGIIGFLSYKGVFEPLTRRNASIIHLMIASMALGFIIRHSAGEIWGWAPLTFGISWPSWDVGPIRVSALWLLLICTALLLAVTLHFVLTKTKIGKAIRATSSNPRLALSSGINTAKVLAITWFVSGGLAGLAGLFKGMETRMAPMLGWDLLLPTFAVTILGGIGSFYGAIIAAFIVGIAENLGTVLLVQMGLSTEYRMAIPFVILIIVLLIKPEGLSKLFKGN